MPVTASIIAGVVGIGTSLYSQHQANQKQKAAQALAAANPRPVYNIPETEFQNQSLLENRASQGLSDESLGFLKQNADRGLSSSINAILRSGGTANQIGGLDNNYNNAITQSALLDDQAKSQNLAALVAHTSRMSDNYDKAFQVNQYGPYADKAQAAKLLQGQGALQQSQAVGNLASVGSSVGNILGKMNWRTTGMDPTPQQNLQGLGTYYSQYPNYGPSNNDPGSGY